MKRGRKRWLVWATMLVFLLVISGGLFWHFTPKKSTGGNSDRVLGTGSNGQDVAVSDAAPKTKLKTFTGNQFRDLYRSVMKSYPNTEAFPTPPEITSDVAADQAIRKLAEARGFEMTRMPVTALVRLNEPLVSGEKDDLLQPLAYEAWKNIKQAAANDGVQLKLLSAYRSPEFQRDLFVERLLAKGATVQQIVRGGGRDAVNSVLGTAAVPGYSRHHTGYTVDFSCGDGNTFAYSSCYRWLSKDNYAAAKQTGWIPSYPEGADSQGPEPEAWEFVWVGRDVLYE